MKNGLRTRTRRVGATLMAAGSVGLLLGSLAVGAQAASTGYTDVAHANAVQCGDLDEGKASEGTSGITLADLPTTEGTYDVSSGDGLFEATVTVDDDTAYSIEVTKGLLLHFVVKGGDNYRVYDFAGVPNDSETGMVSPLNDGGNTPTISHAHLCYGEEQATTTTEEVTTTTEEETTTTVVQTPTTVAAQVLGTVATQAPTTAATEVLGEQLAFTGTFSDVLTVLSGLALVLGGLTLAVSAVPARSRLDA